MITAQDIREKCFEKARIGGYAMDEVDVIVIARGGGAVEDLLPFSNERLVRAVAERP